MKIWTFKSVTRIFVVVTNDENTSDDARRIILANSQSYSLADEMLEKQPTSITQIPSKVYPEDGFPSHLSLRTVSTQSSES